MASTFILLITSTLTACDIDTNFASDINAICAIGTDTISVSNFDTNIELTGAFLAAK